jgi:hypothetical protein
MERIVVVMCGTARTAKAAAETLLKLERTGDIVVYAMATVVREANGNVRAIEYAPADRVQASEARLRRFAAALGDEQAQSVVQRGNPLERDAIEIEDDFAGDVYAELHPDRVALMLEIDEGEVSAVDARMAALHTPVLRRTRRRAFSLRQIHGISALDADLRVLRAEQAFVAGAERQRLASAISQLESKRRRALDAAAARVRLIEAEIEEKIALLNRRIASSSESARMRHAERIEALTAQRSLLRHLRIEDEA